MRKPPFPRAVPHRQSRERWAAAGSCGVLAIGHAMRAAADAHHLAYLSVLDVVAIVAALGAGLQLLLVDDLISWWSAAGVATLLGAVSLVTMTVGFPGRPAAGLLAEPAISLCASGAVIVAALVRGNRAYAVRRDGDSEPRAAVTPPARLRTLLPARHVARAPRGTERAREAHRDPARPAV